MTDEENAKAVKEEIKELSKRFYLKEFKDFTNEVVLEYVNYGTWKKFKRNLELIDYMLYYLQEKGEYNPYNPTKRSDTAILALLVHNLFYDGNPEDWEKVFLLRKEFRKKDIKYLTPASFDAFPFMYQIVESQLGMDMPIDVLRPNNASPTGLVWEILWFVKHGIYNSEVQKTIKQNKEEFTKYMEEK